MKISNLSHQNIGSTSMKNNRSLKLAVQSYMYWMMGLVECSTPKQLKNGTLMYRDTKLKGVYYTFHKSGYFRRRTSCWPSNSAFCGRSYEHYQLNRTGKYADKWGEHTRRILVFNLGKQMEMAEGPIKKYRRLKGVK